METNKAVSEMTTRELSDFLKQKKEAERLVSLDRRNAYEALREDLLQGIESQVRQASEIVKSLYDEVTKETTAFYGIMRDYGQLRREDQMSFVVSNNSFKIEVKHNKVKRFDERADIAASRLIEFMQDWIRRSDKGSDDPMYQLAMTLLERNRYGDLDYKSISKLYDLESRFDDPIYSEIMDLFKQSNVVEDTAINFYFLERTNLGVWRKIEVSFNRL